MSLSQALVAQFVDEFRIQVARCVDIAHSLQQAEREKGIHSRKHDNKSDRL